MKRCSLRRCRPSELRLRQGVSSILVVSLIGAVLAGIGVFSVLSGAFDREWFDF